MDSQSEDKSQKTEAPTPHRLDQAFQKGQVSLSREINHWTILGSAVLSLLFVFPLTIKWLKDLFMPFLCFPHLLTQDYTHFGDLWIHICMKTGLALGLPLGVFTVCALVTGFMQTRFSIAWDALVPKGERLSPMQGVKRLFSKRSLVEFLKNLFKICLVSLAVYGGIKGHLNGFLNWISMPVFEFFTLSQSLMVRILGIILAVLFAIAALDFFYQKFEFLKNLRMTPDEIKKEHKQLEGDPMIKNRLRQLREAMIRRSMIAAVPKATAIITNPTHYAVALEYQEQTMNAPRVIAKGADGLALKIRQLATQHNIPIFEDPPLARSLYDSVDINQDIQPQHYKAVARIIQIVMKLKKPYNTKSKK